MMLFFDLNWLCNYGSNGPILPQFIAFYAFLILVFDKRNLLIVSIILYLNIIVLFLFELFFSQKLGEYENSTIRIYDVYGGIIFSLLVIFFFVQGIKKKYIEEYIKAKKSDQLKSAFISNMSHEIRTPLNAIVGFSSLIVNAENYTAEEKKMFNNQIQLNSDYLLKLIDDIIDVSKIELTQLTVNYKKIQICQLMHQLREMFLISLPEGKNLDIIINSCCEGKIIEVDPLRLEQILRNLISNAIKFTTSGKIELGCSTDAKFYIFFVKDTGIGILPENQQIIFDRFVKIDNKNQPFQQGTGLGLYLSKQLVTIFGGKIWVESVFGKGSCFYFTLPIKHDKD
jgi:signal transduction histidine kinase